MYGLQNYIGFLRCCTPRLPALFRRNGQTLFVVTRIFVFRVYLCVKKFPPSIFEVCSLVVAKMSILKYLLIRHYRSALLQYIVCLRKINSLLFPQSIGPIQMIHLHNCVKKSTTHRLLKQSRYLPMVGPRRWYLCRSYMGQFIAIRHI